MMIDDWFDFALTVFGGAIAFVCLFEGSRRIATHGLHRNVAIMTAMAATFYLLYGAFAYLKYQDLRNRLDAVEHSLLIARPATESTKKLSPEKKEASSLARARLAFAETGALGTYFDRAGKRQAFVPAPEDIRKRERVVVNLVQMSAAAQSSFSEALTWLVTGLLAVLFGYAFSREKSLG